MKRKNTTNNSLMRLSSFINSNHTAFDATAMFAFVVYFVIQFYSDVDRLPFIAVVFCITIVLYLFWRFQMGRMLPWVVSAYLLLISIGGIFSFVG